jgi:NDP-hexose 3,5-(Or5-) epimerase
VQVTETKVPGAYVFTPRQITDVRGAFFESLRTDELERVLGHPFAVRQINYSVSRRNTLRGIHSVTSPPGQAKYVSCVRGALRDFVVDLRVGSPAFGRYDSNVLDAESGRAVYVPEGVGHGFLTLTDDACICYVLSSTYVPGTQIDIDPLDPDLALPWGFTEPPLMSDKDRDAPSLAATLASEVLSPWTA